MTITLEKLLKKIESEPLDNVLSDAGRTFAQILKYLKKDDFERYVKYHTKYIEIQNKKIQEVLDKGI